MKLKLRIFILLLGSISGFLTSCNKVVNPNIIISDESIASEYYKISVDEALSNLNLFYTEVNTKVDVVQKEISCIITVMSDGCALTTKSLSDNPLLYVVNYVDNQGYAILSADRRIPADVLAVTEQGNITEKDINSGLLDLQCGLPFELVRSYASNTIIDVIRDSIGSDDPHRGDTTITLIGGQTVPGIIDGEWIITIWDSIKTRNVVPIMLKTKWGQGVPYNNLCNSRPVGCTAVAMMQIMAYNCYPSPHVIEGVEMPYVELREMEHVYDDDSEYAKAVALMAKSIWDYCNPTILPTGDGEKSTLIWPKYAEKYFRNILGYDNVVRYANSRTCDIDMIVECLKKGYPVLVSAKANAFNAHTWVIDGLVTVAKYGHREGEESGIYRGDEMEFNRYLHCNWGWSGSDDGYFLEGVFDTDISYVFNDFTKSSSDGDYDSYYRIITYEVPNN